MTTFLLAISVLAAEPDLQQALGRACAFQHDKVAVHGGYVYYASLDLKERWGEGKASEGTIFVQPPATPSVGLAFLDAYATTKDRDFLRYARDAGLALVQGQLESGGWTQTIDFVPTSKSGKYRKRKGGSWNASSLDDGQTQTALRFLARLDRNLEFKDEAIHEAALFGFDALLKAQFANGGFPQIWRGPVEPRPIVRAAFPAYDWRTENRIKNYWDQYTLNDDLASTVADALIEAHRVYGDPRYRGSLVKLGEFLLLARMPEPQPGWCQQYDAEMRPIWARKFEPPAISGWESQGAMETLIKIARVTGEKRFLEPIPRSLEYFSKRLLSDGRVARFYELKTDRPLYMDARYGLTYDDSDAPTHYGWKQPARFASIDAAYRAAREGKEEARPALPSRAEVGRALKTLDAEGRWISTFGGERLVGQPKFAKGFRYLSSKVFAQNVETLCAAIRASER